MTKTVAPIPAVAVFIGKSERTVRRWIDEGLLKEYATPSGRRGVCVQDAVEVERLVRTRSRARIPAKYTEQPPTLP